MVGLAFGIILVTWARYYLVLQSLHVLRKPGYMMVSMLFMLGTGICLILDISWWWVLLICGFATPILYGMYLSRVRF